MPAVAATLWRATTTADRDSTEHRQENPSPHSCGGFIVKSFREVSFLVCAGYRADGSFVGFWTIGTEEEARKAVADYLVPFRGRHFPAGVFGHLLEQGGELNPVTMARLKDIATALALRGGHLIVLFPPVIPGLVAQLAAHPVAGPTLQKYTTGFAEFGRLNGVTVLNAGRSEAFGCTLTEFLDLAHPLEACYTKIFQVLRSKPIW